MNIPERDILHRLTHSGVDYIAHSSIGGTTVSITFVGQFHNAPIIWQATLQALNSGAGESGDNQYILIHPPRNDCECDIEIGLQVKAISEPVIIKAITMVRQYKNLNQGRHEFLGANK